PQRVDVEVAALDDEVGAVEPAAGRGHRALGGVQEPEQRAVVAVGQADVRRGPVPQRVAAVRLDLDDVGTRVCEQLGAVRTRYPARAVEDADAVEHAGYA